MHLFDDVTEVRAILALALTLSMIAFVVLGKMEASDLIGPFSTIVGFYFAAKAVGQNGHNNNNNGGEKEKA